MTVKTVLFDQTLTASLLQPLSSNQSDFKVYKAHIKLTITEERNDTSSEKELKFEISRTDDFEFLYAEVLNNGKYHNLAREHDLTVDFEAFPRTIIQNLLSRNVVNRQDHELTGNYKLKGGSDSIATSIPTEVNIQLNNEKSYCLFEIYSRTPISKGKIFSMKLIAVRGDQLISHLLSICSDQSKNLNILEKTTKELDTLRKRLADVECDSSRIDELEKELGGCIDRIKELEDDLELAKEERESIRALAEDKDFLIEKLQTENDAYTREAEEIKEELEIVGNMLKEEQVKADQLQRKVITQQKEICCLQSEKVSARNNLDKTNFLLKKYEDQQGQQSIDLRKLRELEGDLKEKDIVINSMRDTLDAKRKELNDQIIKWSELSESHDRLKGENDVLKERLNVYRNSVMPGYSPANAHSALTPLGTLGTTRSNYRNVLGPVSSNSPFGTPEFEKKNSSREAPRHGSLASSHNLLTPPAPSTRNTNTTITPI